MNIYNQQLEEMKKRKTRYMIISIAMFLCLIYIFLDNKTMILKQQQNIVNVLPASTQKNIKDEYVSVNVDNVIGLYSKKTVVNHGKKALIESGKTEYHFAVFCDDNTVISIKVKEPDMVAKFEQAEPFTINGFVKNIDEEHLYEYYEAISNTEETTNTKGTLNVSMYEVDATTTYTDLYICAGILLIVLITNIMAFNNLNRRIRTIELDDVSAYHASKVS